MYRASDAREWNESTRAAIEVWRVRPGVCHRCGESTGELSRESVRAAIGAH